MAGMLDPYTYSINITCHYPNAFGVVVDIKTKSGVRLDFYDNLTHVLRPPVINNQNKENSIVDSITRTTESDILS